MKYIQKARDIDNVNIEVKAPIKNVTKDMSFEEMVRAAPINTVDKFESNSILSQLKTGNQTYTDIAGMTLKMYARIDDKIFEDTVTIKGERGNFFYIEINGEIYSIYKTIVIFAKE